MLEKFHAVCNKGQCDGVKFTDPATLKTHLKDAHGTRVQTPGTKFSRKGLPLPSSPAVRPDRQKVTPGTEFTHKGYPCQVIGHTSADKVAFLFWTDGEGEPERNIRTAELISTDPDGVRMYRMTAPTDKVVKAVSEG